jgi:hypothetical protein
MCLSLHFFSYACFFIWGFPLSPKNFAIWLTIANICLSIWSLHSFLHLHVLSSGGFPLQPKNCYLTDYSKHLFMCFKFVLCFQYLPNSAILYFIYALFVIILIIADPWFSLISLILCKGMFFWRTPLLLGLMFPSTTFGSEEVIPLVKWCLFQICVAFFYPTNYMQ